MSKLQSFFSRTLSLTAYDLCDLQAVEDDQKTFVTADGFYCSALRLEGALQYLGELSHPEAVEKMTQRLSSLWKEPGRQIQVVYVQDPEAGADYESDKQLNQLLGSAKRLNLNIDPIIKERRALWKGKVFHENCVVIVKTSLASLSRTEQEKATKETRRLPYAKHAQDPGRAYTRLLGKHKSFVRTLEQAMGAACVISEVDVQELARMINTFITGRYDDEFRLKLSQNGKRVVPPRLQDSAKTPGDPSCAMQPPFAHQFFTQRPEEVADEPSLVRIHNRYIAPIQIETWSDLPEQFNELVSRVGRRFPFAVSFTFQTGKDQLSSFLNKSWRMAKLAEIFNKSNKEQAAAAKVLKDYLASNTSNGVLGHMAMFTWGSDKEQALSRKEELSAAATAWCGVRPVEYLDDPVGLWIECIPGLARKPVSIPSAIRLEDAFTYLPIDRPATFFKEGSMPLFSTDYKFMPFRMGASFQRTWNNNWFAPPGSGKSVGIFGSCLSLLLNEENRQVPRQVFLDIGHAGTGLVKLFKAIFGPENAHRAQHFTLRNDGSTFINPFDTMTCNRKPTQQEKQDITAMLSIIFSTEDGADSKFIELLIPDLINKAYELRSDHGNGKNDPHQYKKHVVPEIDQRLEQGDIKLEDSPYWWEVADQLLYKEEYLLANRATRQAVPLLRDLNIIIAQDDDIKRKYADVAINGQPILDYIRLFTESYVTNIQLLSAPTNFDATDTDLIIFNLQEVVNTDDAAGRKVSAAMFLLAMIAGAREFFQTPDVVDSPDFSSDPAIKSYHRERIRRNFATKRHLVLDEYHVFNQVPSLDDRIIKYRRIGRKNNTIITLATQFDYHVTPEQRAIATNTFFMSADDKAKMLDRQSRYKFSDDILNFAMREQVGPGTMLHFAEKKESTTWQVCRDMKGPLELWAFSSTSDDIDLRTSLEERVGFWEACTILSKEFPGGSLGEFQPKYVRYLQKVFARHEDLQDKINCWNESLAKKMINEPGTWRLQIQEDSE
jgi:intracellular multiplication protein IcmB